MSLIFQAPMRRPSTAARCVVGSGSIPIWRRGAIDNRRDFAAGFTKITSGELLSDVLADDVYPPSVDITADTLKVGMGTQIALRKLVGWPDYETFVGA